MSPKTSRCTRAESFHLRTDDDESEPISSSANSTPAPMTRWWGLTRIRRMGRKLVRESALVRLAEAFGHRGQELVGHGRDLVDHARELALAEDEHIHVGVCDDRGRAGAAVEQGQLAEVLTGAELGDLLLAPENRCLAVEDQEELVPGSPLLDQHLALLHPHIV